MGNRTEREMRARVALCVTAVARRRPAPPGYAAGMDDPGRERFDAFELAHPELALAAREALASAPRLSPAARAFMAGQLDAWVAQRLGYVRGML